MKFLAVLFMIGALVANSTQDAEIDDLFDQLESALKQDANIANKIDKAKEDIKAEIGKAPQKRARFLGAAKALNGAVVKLQSNDPWVITQGVLNVVAGIAEFVPGGVIISSVISVISSVIGIMTGQKAEQTLSVVVSSAVRDESDSELIGLSKAAKQELVSAFSPLETYKDQELDDKAANFLTNQIKVNTGISILEMLAHRIGERKRSTEGNQQLNCYRLSLLYAQIASLRDWIINDLIMQLRNSKHERFADSYAHSLENHMRTYKDVLGFYADPKISESGVVHFVYPLGHSNDSIFIQDFIKMAGVTLEPRNLAIPGLHSVYSKYWSTQYLSLESLTIFNAYYLAFRRGLDGLWRFRFEKRSDGFWIIKVEDYWMKFTDGYVGVQDNKPTDKQVECHFQIMSFKEDPKIITISSRKTPGYFWKGVSGDQFLVVSKGYDGEPTQFLLEKEAEGSKKKSKKSRFNKKKRNKRDNVKSRQIRKNRVEDEELLRI